ncbi:MAG: M23 family metallopeptidase [Deltaproteobacteria bacterium]|nr:M23 family metallopeptidase [Deltaproteobacteria bacterium]
MSNYLRYMLILIILVALSAGIWFLAIYYEGEKPVITVSEPLTIIGQRKSMNISCTDKKSGLRHITATITQDGKQHILYIDDFPRRGVTEKTITIQVDAKPLILHDGPATFEVLAVDHSLKKNSDRIVLKVTVDITPPTIYPVSTFHNINPGGSCITLYRLSEDITNSYVYVGDNRFFAYPIKLSGKACYICYFALPADGDFKNPQIGITAEDKAGNISSSAIHCHIRTKNFRSRIMNISDRFLTRKIPEFRHGDKNMTTMSLIESFQYINETYREKNLKTIESICRESEGEQLWQGTFLRMKNAATMAKFGDRRTYRYQGKDISKSVHMGVDLASTKNALIEASNSGIVVFCGYLGIYGNSVMIDHGFGLFSFYGHLGVIHVKKGQKVKKGNPIGRSDTTGLAGGDHLHFGIFVGNTFVDPQEWWDSHWIRDNVERKLNVTF